MFFFLHVILFSSYLFVFNLTYYILISVLALGLYIGKSLSMPGACCWTCAFWRICPFKCSFKCSHRSSRCFRSHHWSAQSNSSTPVRQGDAHCDCSTGARVNGTVMFHNITKLHFTWPRLFHCNHCSLAWSKHMHHIQKQHVRKKHPQSAVRIFNKSLSFIFTLLSKMNFT